VREQVRDYLTQICNGNEAATFVIPNRTVQPRETWPVKLPMLLKTGTKAEVVDLVMTCTLEGVRTAAAGNPEALVTFDGKVQSRSAREKLDGRVAGRFTFDINRGFISSVKTTISSEASSPGGEFKMVFAFDIDMTRGEGNPGKVALPKSGTAPAPVAKKGTPSTGTPGKDYKSGGDVVTAKLFKKPAASKEPTSYMKVVSEQGDYIGQGKNYDYAGDKLNVRVTQRGLTIQVDGWSLNVGGPAKQFIKEGEYPDAKRFPFSGDSPGLEFGGKGRGSNSLTGAFVVWELEIKDNKVVKLALDFVQHPEGKTPALTGKVRINSTLE
jgi:hypothetical protein